MNVLGIVVVILIVIFCAAVSFFVGVLYRKKVAESKIGTAEAEAVNIIENAKQNAESHSKEILLEAKEESIKVKNDFEKEAKERRNELNRLERRIMQKEEQIDKKSDSLEKKEEKLQSKIEKLDEKYAQADEINAKQIAELERISNLTTEQAKSFLLSNLEKELKVDESLMIKEMEAKAKLEADKRAKNLVANAIQRCAIDHVTESSVSVVTLPNDEMKGRIIGREGRNIRALESITGVDLIIDDTPEAVILSGFDPIRREIAKIALEKLILDGRVHPARIEETVEKARKEVEVTIREEGESATFEVGVHGLHPELIRLLGKMKYRTSYGQNALKHSIEVAFLCGALAGELGEDINMAKRAGLLHDIGKSIDHDVEGSHVTIGAGLCRKYKEPEIVINAVESHHGDVEPNNVISVLVAAADAISAARPGARRETLESYIKRLQNLEDIANSFEGVDKSFAIQAGRELRIIVISDEIDDAEMTILARKVSKRIENELEYPGQIKVSLIRETRAVEYAK